MAVDAGDVVLAVNAGAQVSYSGCWALSMGVLEGMGPVGKANLIVILLPSAHCGALVPGNFTALVGPLK